jgi:N-methylhydantoinase A
MAQASDPAAAASPAAAADRRYRLGFDIGGTFTDFVLIDDATGRMTSYKTLTTPHAPAQAVMEGVTALLERVGAGGQAIETAIHGTTLITNALIERKGARTAFITTRGFRDVLEIAREMRYDIYDLLLVLPPPLVDRPLRLEVSERLNGRGEVVIPLNLDELAELVPQLQREQVEAVAVCLLHSYRNPAHEQAIRTYLQQALPGVSIAISSEVAPEIREYERMSTTVANAFVQPLTEQYLSQLEQRLREAGFERRLYLMLSSGGIGTVETAERFPVRLLESGPAAGVLAATFYGGVVDQPSLVSFDMGGTTAKMCLIKDGRPTMTSTFEVARVHRFKRGSGLPVRIPAIELIEIGAGGGSIARINELGLLKVGPDSAGADPGPACYGFGGERPTVTDANLVLGYLNPAYFLGGRMTLDVAAAEAAVDRDIGGPLGVSTVTAAYGIHQVVNESMIAATRIHVAERGADPRRLMLISFGGAGPIHAHQIARALKMRGYIVPAGAGVTSALGFLTAPASFDFARSFVARMTPDLMPQLDAIYQELEDEGRAMLREAGVAESEMRFLRQADLRHVGQGHEIPLPLPYERLADVDLDGVLRPYFYEFYAGIYGHAHTHLALEIMTVRVTATGPRPRVTLREAPGDVSDAAAARKGSRPVYFAETQGFVETPVYDRTLLTAGMRFNGPAIVEEQDSTAVIGPNAEVTVDRFANLLATFPQGDA